MWQPAVPEEQRSRRYANADHLFMDRILGRGAPEVRALALEVANVCH